MDTSFSQAREFFDRYFPDKAVSVASCDSWMLDPYLARKLPHSNIAAFARRFTLDRCSDAPGDAVYFTFRQRGMENLDRLPARPRFSGWCWRGSTTAGSGNLDTATWRFPQHGAPGLKRPPRGLSCYIALMVRWPGHESRTRFMASFSAWVTQSR
ncbi:conserved hypothetical protein [Arthrobacter sp. Hiyo8]|nr:conserved hypothetical protein [Arthrobacter sp. Hiyo8]